MSDIAIPRIGLARKAFGLVAAALTAWLVLTIRDMGPPYLEALRASSSDPDAMTRMNAIIFLYAQFGIPLALVVCLCVGIPAWAIVDRHNLHKPLDAIKVGAVAGAVVFLGGVVLTLLVGLLFALTDSYYSATRAGGETVRDGLPTAYGWLLKLAELPVDIVVGGLAGLAAWTAAGMGRRRTA